MLASLRRLDFTTLEALETRVPDMVGTAALGRSPGGGGGRQGALGGGGLGLSQQCSGLPPVSLTRNFLAGLLNLSRTVGTVQGRCSRGRRLMTRRTGTILLDLELRMYMAVDNKTVSPTKIVMTKATTPRAFMGLCLLFIKKAAIGPLRGVWKRAQIKGLKSSQRSGI